MLCALNFCVQENATLFRFHLSHKICTSELVDAKGRSAEPNIY